MSVELKVKSKHLSEEARIIRFEENKFRKQVDWLKERQQPYQTEHDTMMSLKDHRRKDVRNENRATFLARTYLAGKSYKSVEQKRHEDVILYMYILPRVYQMANKYGPVKDRVKKQWNSAQKRYEYDPAEWKIFVDKVNSWVEAV